MPVLVPDLSDSDLRTASAWIAGAKHIVVLTGAGVSAESGIPTFRGPGGLWRGRDPMSLATPEAFAADPALVWEFYNWRRGLVGSARPNLAHLALAALADAVPRLSLITQNVDRLHHRAGSRDVLEVHGNLDEVRCTRCALTSNRRGEPLPELPACESCGALVRPAVVWFGEPLPRDVWEAAEAAVVGCDLMLVVGTGAAVYPAAGLIDRAPGRVVEVNVAPSGAEVDLGLYGPAGEILPRLVPSAAGVPS